MPSPQINRRSKPTSEQEEAIVKIIRKNRPNIGTSSINTYLSNLRNIYRKTELTNDTVPPFNLDFFKNNTKDILKFLSNLEPASRKLKSASLVVLCGTQGECKQYHDSMYQEIKEYEDDLALNKKNEKQEKNWITQEEVNSVFNTYESQLSNVFAKIRKNETITKNELRHLQNFITLALYVLQAPRRIQDYTLMKINNVNTRSDNYIKGKNFVFNNFKTVDSFGQQVIPINPKLLKYLKLYVKVNPTDYLLFDTKGNPLSPPQMTQRLQDVFGRNVSVNMLRHSYITENLGGKIEELDRIASDMGHSSSMQKGYVKN
jgi:integrase